jgi:hypothetical protein
MTHATRRKLVLVCVVGTVLVFVWVASQPSKLSGKDWLLVSRPALVRGTHTAESKVTFRVSNVGPRSVDFRVSWFECRAKTDRTPLATNQLDSVEIPLGPGESTNLAMDVSLGGVPVADCWCCYKIYWFQRAAPVRKGFSRLWGRWFGLFGVKSEPPWGPERLLNGSVIASNVEAADYFGWMYGWTRQTWLEDLARMQSARTGAVQRRWGGPGPPRTSEYLTRLAARGAFIGLCQSFTNGAPDAERAAAPNAAPPHR